MQSHYERQLLERLLNKYEKSKAYTTGRSPRRIALTASGEGWLQSGMEDPEEKRLFLAVLAELKKQGLIDYSWVKYETGNLVDKIWLVQEENGIWECYRRIGRTPPKDQADELLLLLKKYTDRINAQTPLGNFLEMCGREIRAKRKCPSYFTEDEALNEDILKCLVYMEQNENEQLERLMSQGLYGDSKRFERAVKPKVLSILRAIKREAGEDVPEDEELLREKGIARWPEVLEFTGRLRVCLADGSQIDYTREVYGAYINSVTVVHIARVEAEGIGRVLFIENKANYVWYVSRGAAADELVIYHGGCYSPVKGKWFRKIVEGLNQQPQRPEYYHWSDIDLGGFRIFQRLRETIIPELLPYRMDLASLMQYRDKAAKITSASYLKALKALWENPDYECFHEVIGKMLEEKIRLEQEGMCSLFVAMEENKNEFAVDKFKKE